MVVDEDWITRAVMVGMVRMATVASSTEAVAVDRAGWATVVMPAARVWCRLSTEENVSSRQPLQYSYVEVRCTA